MNKMKSKKEAAVSLWEQMLERAKENEWSTFVDPTYVTSSQDVKNTRQAFNSAGWNEKAIDLMEKVDTIRAEAAPNSSPGVARFTEANLFFLSQKIENAAILLKVENRDKVHFVVEPKAGPFISKINVIMTDQSIISMGSFFTRYCGLIAKAYVRTIHLCPYSTGLNFDESYLRLQLRKSPDLLFYWWQIFISFALTGTHVLVPFKPSTKSTYIEKEQMANAMEIFGLSHEYSHHALNHGRRVGGEGLAKEEEFQADAFALRICELIEIKERNELIEGVSMPNPFLSTGSGGVLLLGSLEIFRKVKDIVFTNRKFDTHPSFEERSHKIQSRYVMQPNKNNECMDFCSSARNVLNCVMLEMETIMAEVPFTKYSQSSPADWEEKSFE